MLNLNTTQKGTWWHLQRLSYRSTYHRTYTVGGYPIYKVISRLSPYIPIIMVYDRPCFSLLSSFDMIVKANSHWYWCQETISPARRILDFEILWKHPRTTRDTWSESVYLLLDTGIPLNPVNPPYPGYDSRETPDVQMQEGSLVSRSCLYRHK